MLTRLKDRLTAEPVNTSRIRLREFAAEAAAVGTDKSFRVLDAGAGSTPYRDLFDHVSYEACDLEDNGLQDYVCDIAALPMPDNTYDLVFCSQTLEHVPNPFKVMGELQRVLKPGGQLWMSAPFIYEEHVKPYDFFRYTRFAWRRMGRRAGLDVQSVDVLEGYYGTLSYHLHTGYRTLPRRMVLTRVALILMARRMAREEMSEKLERPGLCKNYRVVMTKPAADRS